MTRQALPEPLHRCKRPRPAIPCESSPIAAISISSPSGLATVTNAARRPAVIRSAPDVALATQPAPYARRTCARAQRNAARSLASVFSASFVSAAVLSTAVLACATERGKGWDLAAPAPAPPAVSLLLLGEAGFPGRTAKLVAAEVERTLAARREAGVPVVLLWLGDAIGDACAPAAAWSRPGVAQLARVARTHQGSGGGSFAVLGVHEWRCGAPELTLRTGADIQPWLQPAANYVLRIERDGRAAVASTCSNQLCAVDAPGPDALVDLVLVDTAAWQGPPPPALRAAADASLAQQQALLAALEAAPPQPSVPRLLVSHHPIETAGAHGQGGLFPDSAFSLHSEPLRRAIDGGLFAGALSGHDRTLSATADIFDATKRSSRFWLKQPVFQVVSGATARPDGPRGGRRGWVFYQGQALQPDLLTNRAGFAELLVSPDDFAAQLHQRKHGRWRAARLTIPRGRPPHPAETPSPVMDPCLRCDPRPPPQ